MFSGIFSLSNAKKAAPVVASAYIAQQLTATQSKWLQGGAMLAAGMVAAYFSAKL
jgi:hypothetical protein